MSSRPLRVGLLLDSLHCAAWEACMFEHIMRGEFADISLLVISDNERKLPNRSVLAKIKNNFGSITASLVENGLNGLYRKLIERNIRLPDANESVDCEGLLQGVPRLLVKTDRRKWSDYFYPDDVDAIKAHGCDILVRCGFGILRGDILKAARYGIWSYHHGDNLVNRGGPPGYWESMEGWPETGSVLQILTEDLDNGQILYRSFSMTKPMSVTDNRSNYYWKSLSFMTRKMDELYRLGERAFFDAVTEHNRHPSIYSERLYTKPNNTELARLVFGKVAEKIRLLIRNRIYFDQWILLFHLRDDFSSSLWRYKKILPPKDRFWADPHVLWRNDSYYIFIEELPYATGKGHISVIEMDQQGHYCPPRPVLERPYHLSYPFLFEFDGELYMVPESMANQTIELYRCVEFPTQWEFQMNLMEGIRAVDATLVQHGGRWWLFAGVAEHPAASASDELCLFSADTPLTSDWQPHPMNPIVSDCKSARPAGALFRRDGALYRPSQNCSTRYGYGFNLSQVTELNEQYYAETVVSRASPNWEPEILGVHTFNRAGRLHIIDAYYQRRR